MREEMDDDDQDEPRPLPRVPGLVRTAGVLWIAYGSLGLLTTLVGFIMQAGNQAAAGGNPGGNTPTSPCCSIIITIAFMYCGIQSLQGTAKDTLGNSIGSLVFGALQFAAGVFFILVGLEIIQLAMFVREAALAIGAYVVFMSSLLLAAGVLGLMGRSAYREWREVAHPRKKRRRPRREEEVDEEDER